MSITIEYSIRIIVSHIPHVIAFQTWRHVSWKKKHGREFDFLRWSNAAKLATGAASSMYHLSQSHSSPYNGGLNVKSLTTLALWTFWNIEKWISSGFNAGINWIIVRYYFPIVKWPRFRRNKPTAIADTPVPIASSVRLVWSNRIPKNSTLSYFCIERDSRSSSLSAY